LLVEALKHFPLKDEKDEKDKPGKKDQALLKEIFNTDSSNFDTTEKEIKKVLEELRDFVEKIPEPGNNFCECRSHKMCQSGSVAFVMKGKKPVHFCPEFMDSKEYVLLFMNLIML
jgi:hypothetical protein